MEPYVIMHKQEWNILGTHQAKKTDRKIKNCPTFSKEDGAVLRRIRSAYNGPDSSK
jgi:hypothetical protein